MHPLFSVEGRKILVTGATKGIGRAACQLFLELGAQVLAVARTETDLVLAKAEWKTLGRLHTCVADVSTVNGRLAVLQALNQHFEGGLDALVNNVGTNIRKPLASFELDDLRTLMATNTEAAFELSKMLKPSLLKTDGGCIVNVSSVCSYNVVGTSTVGYAMSKGALDNLTRWLAVEWGPLGIRVNGVHPWYTNTALVEPLLKYNNLTEKIKEVTPLQRIAEPKEIAAVIAFLTMPGAGFITGSDIIVDGGYLSKGISAI